MEFPYVRVEAGRRPVYRPYLPVTFSYGTKRVPVGHALVDTGSDITILPLEIAHVLGVRLDDTEGIAVDGAGGGSFVALPSLQKVGFTIERDGYRPIRWDGIPYFARGEPVVLLGHRDCLEKFDLTFRGPEKKLGVLPCFAVQTG